MRTRTLIFFLLAFLGVTLLVVAPHTSHAANVPPSQSSWHPALLFTGLSWTNSKTYVQTKMKDGVHTRFHLMCSATHKLEQ